MIYEYVKRGVAAGLLAGVAYGLYVALVAAPLLGYVHEVGAGHGDDTGHAAADGAHGHEHGTGVEHGAGGEHEVGAGHGHEVGAGHGAAGGHEHAQAVSETTGAIVNVGSGVLWAILLAGVFALAYHLFEPALPGVGATKAAVLGAAGFVSVSVVPWLVLPPMVPGAEATVGIDARLAIYAALVGVSLLASGLSIAGYRRLASGGRLRALAVALVPIGLVVVALATHSPQIVVQPAVADDLVLSVQGAAAVSQAGLWAGIAGAFAWLQGRGAFRSAPHRGEIDADGLATA